MERISRLRAVILLLFFVLILVLFSVRLFNLQIIETDGNTDNTQTFTTLTTVRAARGDILDRNGNVLVGNRASYNLVFNHYVIESSDGTNNSLYRLVKKCEELGVDYLDHFPITQSRPFEYTLQQYNTSWQGYFQTFMRDFELDSDITAPLLVETLRERYDIPAEWTDEEARAVIGLRYEFDLRGVTNLSNYVFIEDVEDETLSAILELNTPGLMVEASTVREYHTTYAAHVLGSMGAMTEEQWAEYKKQDYSMDAMVGQSGFELAFEEELHGIDGTRVDVVDKNGTIISQYYANIYDEDGNIIGKMAPQAGNNVETTIDLELQIVAEDALAEIMEYLTDPTQNVDDKGNPGDGLDAEGAAVIVMEVKTGKILACASYPTYNLATMVEDWDAILADERKPLFNRAFGAAYAPGSTFKMCTLISAMENRNSLGEIILEYQGTITDKGAYTEHEGFSPKCLLYSSTDNIVTHGELDGTQALMVSCNYFFYRLGDLMTWNMVADTATKLGLGVPTGIELEEEVGRQNTEQTKLEVYKSGVNATMTAGDRILGAIGQGENRFTPLQLCVYASTLANQGKRYRATFLNRVVSSDYSQLISETQPEIVSTMDLAWTTVETYMTGMYKVVMGDSSLQFNGTAAGYFGGKNDYFGIGDGVWPMKGKVTVYAKTGTAEHSSGGSDHGAFICFAHKSDQTEPDVAVAIYGEKVAHGASLAPVAEKILLAYYNMVGASEVLTYENHVS